MGPMGVTMGVTGVMRLAPALMLVVATACHASSESVLAPEAELPLASHVVPPAEAPTVTELIYVTATGAIRTAPTVAPWDAPRTPVAAIEPDSPRRRALEAALDAALVDPTRLQIGELAGAQGMPLAGLSHAPLLLAPPTAPAVAIAKIVANRGGMLAVSVAGGTGILPVGFGPVRDARTSTHGGWAELWGDGDSLVLLESKTGASRVVRFDAGMVDSEALRGALAELPPTYAIDIVVGADFTVQQLVDAIGVIRGAGWSRLQLLVAMGTREQRRAELVQIGAPHIAIGQPNAQGDLDKAIIRQTIKTATDQLLRCYTSALETSPQLRGTVSIQFLIQNTGVVSNATGSGVSPVVASCVAAVIQRLTFPHPKGGGLVQVNYPFTFRNGY